MPTFEGPQIQKSLPGFHKEPDAGQTRKMFPAWESVYHDALVSAAWGDVSTIHINGYPGALMRSDVQAALEDAIATATDPVTFSSVQEMTIDGRTAWGWAERVQTDEEGLLWIAYRVAIPYEAITYTVELESSEPTLKSDPDSLLTIASAFAVGKTTWNYPLILGICAAFVGLILVVRKRAREKAIRLQSITLKKVEIKAEEAKKADGGEVGKKKEEVGSQFLWKPTESASNEPGTVDSGPKEPGDNGAPTP